MNIVYFLEEHCVFLRYDISLMGSLCIRLNKKDNLLLDPLYRKTVSWKVIFVTNQIFGSLFDLVMQTIHILNLDYFFYKCPNLMNLSRVLKPPKIIGFNWAPALNLETINSILSGTNHIWAAFQIQTAAQIL